MLDSVNCSSGVARNCTGGGGGGGGGGGFPAGLVGEGGGVAPPSLARGYGGAL